MSRFNEFAADAIARAAVRGNAQPLVGREAALLVALRAAEAAHDKAYAVAEASWQEAEANRDAFEALRDGPLAKFGKHIAAARDSWRTMNEQGRSQLAFMAVNTSHPYGAVIGDWDGTTSQWLDPVVARIDQSLDELVRLHQTILPVENGGEMYFSRGRPDGQFQVSTGRRRGGTVRRGGKVKQGDRSEPVFDAGLTAFASVLRSFWQTETGLPFSIEFGDTEPTPEQARAGKKPADLKEAKSPAAKMLWTAASYFHWPDGRPPPTNLYLIENVETVAKRMRGA